MRTRNQRYAEQIFLQVEELRAAPEAAKKYGSMAHKLPVLIRTAGLAQALAFVALRGNQEHEKLLNHLSQVLGLTDGPTLVSHTRSLHLTEYMRLTRQVLVALVWYKRFAESVLGVQAGDEPEVTQ